MGARLERLERGRRCGDVGSDVVARHVAKSSRRAAGGNTAAGAVVAAASGKITRVAPPLTRSFSRAVVSF